MRFLRCWAAASSSIGVAADERSSVILLAPCFADFVHATGSSREHPSGGRWPFGEPRHCSRVGKIPDARDELAGEAQQEDAFAAGRGSGTSVAHAGLDGDDDIKSIDHEIHGSALEHLDLSAELLQFAADGFATFEKTGEGAEGDRAPEVQLTILGADRGEFAETPAN